MYKRTEDNKENGKQAEEIAMMPKRGWVSDDEVNEDDEETRCKPSWLQRFANPWLFIFTVGFGALAGDALLVYLKFQSASLRRQFEVDEETITWMSYSSEIACVVSAIFLSILAKKIHLPRALAISSVILGIASLLCVIPYAVTKNDLVPAPTVLENETYSMEKFKMMAPSCIENKRAMAVIQRLVVEDMMASKAAEKAGNGSAPGNDAGNNQPAGPSEIKDMGTNLTESSQKAKEIGTDIDEKHDMKAGIDDTDSYRVKRSPTKRRVNLETDLAYTGQLVKRMKMMPPIKPEIMEKAFKELCPFNTGPFMVNSSTGILKVINVAMILQGIARGPRLAYAAVFLLENSLASSLSLHFGVLFGVIAFCSFSSLTMSVYFSTSYITMEDVGFMTMFNPRWLPAWWVGFVMMALTSFFCAVPLFLLPRKLKGPRKYTITTSSDDRACYSFGGYIKDLLASSFRVFTNPIYLAVVLGTIFSLFAWTGISHIIFNYVTQQFSLEPFAPGLYLSSCFILMLAIGIIIGGVIGSKRKFTPLSHLKFALLLACVLVIIQACNLGFGCSQPSTDKGLRIVTHISNDTNCGHTCPCSDMGFSPACGSDGRTYYSPCHAGCGEGFDGKFHDCKCIEDMERTVTPGYCPYCNFYYPFFVVFCLGGFILGLQLVPWFTATYRSVKEKDVPVALGFFTMLIVFVVYIPSPVVYQTLEDRQCINRIFECGIINTCVRYNIENVRLHVFGLSLAMQAVSALLFLVAFVFGRKSSIYHEQIHTKEQVKA